MKRKLVQEQWGIFSERVIPVDAPEIQKTEMRRAYYAGAEAIMFRVMTVLSAGRDEVTEDDIQALRDLQAEFQEFAEDIRAGRA